MVNQYVEHLLSIIMQKKLKKKRVWEKIKNIYFYVKSKFIQKCLKLTGKLVNQWENMIFC